MSATYNWAYRPGVANKYGIVINSSADGVRPSNACYVGLFGSNLTGNGSRLYPYRTLAFAMANIPQSFAGILIIGAGTYREGNLTGQAANSKILVGDGDVTIDFSYFNGLYTDNGGIGSIDIYNIKLKGSGVNYFVNNGAGTGLGAYDCNFDGCRPTAVGVIRTENLQVITGCVFANYSGTINIGDSFNSCVIRNSTFYNITSINIVGTNNGLNVRACIFQRCNINYNAGSIYPIYSLFHQCNFRFTNSNQLGGALYPDTPSGYTYISDIATLRSNYITVYGNVQNPMPYCAVTDPKFNNASIGDYTLAFDSPAKNLSYLGTYIGAKSIAQPIKARSTESAGAFEFASAVNLIIADDSLTLTDPSLNGQIDTKVIVNTLGRELASFPNYGSNADRNGQYVDSIADLDTITKAVGDTLSVSVPYIVENGAIVYNSANYQPGDRFTTVSGQTTFTSVTSGVVREILEAPQRHTIMARFSDGGAAVTVGDTLVSGHYYYVVSGSVTYESNTYNAGDVFKAVNTNSFSGSGIVILALSTESFQHYEPGIKPTSNNTGDSRTGAIVRGNGDPAYDRGGLGVKEFPVNAKFIQMRYLIRASNLKP